MMTAAFSVAGKSRRSGVALILVLAFLVLISGLVLAFFSSVTTDLNASKTSENGVFARQFAETAVQIVEGQIRDATTKGSSVAGTPGAGNPVAWASQPGMIRTYHQKGSGGKQAGKDPFYYYKLYSNRNMVMDETMATAFRPKDDLDIAWNTKTAVWVDMNEPIVKPVVDAGGNTTTKEIFPIVNPNVTGVEGFSYQANGVLNGMTSSTGTKRLPMPVQWLYVLNDGSTISPDSNATGNTATFNQTAKEKRPSSDNPIIGRVAFWTDDETSKVNINTASEGTYWDTPHIDSSDDRGAAGSVTGGTVASTPGLALCQPANLEYQRYPGHPATVCLSTVLGWFLGDPNKNGASITTGTSSQLEPYYEIVPRVVGGGSKGGTVIPSGALKNDPLTGQPDVDRLYASIDELTFDPKRGPMPSKSTSKAITQDVLDKVRFFLTANSRAPEITLFNSPRVSMWPIPTGTDEQGRTNTKTAFDSLAEFCGKMNGVPFYVSRTTARNGNDGTANTALFNYLQALSKKSIPGFGGNFYAKYPVGNDNVSDCDQIMVSILDYIRCVNMADTTQGAKPFTPIANWQTTDFASSAGAGEVVPMRIGGLQGNGRFDTVTEMDLLFYAVSAPAAVIKPPLIIPAPTNPYKIASKMRAVVVLKFGTPMVGNAAYQPKLTYRISNLDGLTITNSNNETKPLLLPATCFNLVEIPDSQTNHGRGQGGVEGPAMAFQNAHWNTTQAKQLAASGGASDRTASGHNYPFFSGGDVSVGLETADAKGDSAAAIQAAVTADLQKPFLLNAPANGKPIVIEIYTDGPQPQLVQKLNINIPQQTIVRKPRLQTGTDSVTNALDLVVNGQQDFNRRLLPNTSKWSMNAPVNWPVLIQDADTVLGIELGGTQGSGDAPGYDNTAGDMRMISCLPEVPATMFRPHMSFDGTYQDKDKKTFDDKTFGRFGGKAYGLITARGDYYPSAGTGVDSTGSALVSPVGATGGKLVANVNYQTSGGFRQPGITSRVDPTKGVLRVDGYPGDFDTGPGVQKDGAFINKPDEGDLQFTDYLDGTPRVPYITKDDHSASSATVFSPNREIPSPMMIGSIPTGVHANKPWQTLLFCPKPEDTNHPGKLGSNPKDYLIADLFWMPTVEPYAISEPASTAGKINMNYQLMPFGAADSGSPYIRRDTGVRAVMKSTKFMALLPGDAASYKPAPEHMSDPLGIPGTRRHAIDPTTTLNKGFETVFNGTGGSNPDIFHSATQICDVNLYPIDATSVDPAGFWKQYSLTGDNLREKPYVDLYARLTTKSNSYTVHVRAQRLQKVIPKGAGPSDPRWVTWNDSKDRILGEYRGSSQIERYIDPNDPALPKTYLNVSSTATVYPPDINQYYRFRTVNNKQFGQ